MLDIKFQAIQPCGSGKKRLFKVFTICGCGGHLGHVT